MWLPLIVNETLKWLSPLPILKQNRSDGDRQGLRYSLPLPPPLGSRSPPVPLWRQLCLKTSLAVSGDESQVWLGNGLCDQSLSSRCLVLTSTGSVGYRKCKRPSSSSLTVAGWLKHSVVLGSILAQKYYVFSAATTKLKHMYWVSSSSVF